MSKFSDTIQNYANEIGWLINTQDGFPDNTCTIVRTNDVGILQEIYRVELIDEQIVVFSNSVPEMYSSPEKLPNNLSASLLHRNSKVKGFWGATGVQVFGEEGLVIGYFRQVYLSELNAAILKDIVTEIQGETSKMSRLFK